MGTMGLMQGTLFGIRGSRRDFTKRSGKVYGLLGISTCVTCAAFASHSTLVTYHMTR